MTGYTYPSRKAIRRRMNCDARTASRIRKTFVSVENLVEAIESDEPLTEVEGIGSHTESVILEWWENRHEREDKVDTTEFEKTGSKTGVLHNLGDWSDAIE